MQASAANQAREMAARAITPFAVKAWSDANMSRLNVKPSDWTSMKEITDEGEDLQD